MAAARPRRRGRVLAIPATKRADQRPLPHLQPLLSLLRHPELKPKVGRTLLTGDPLARQRLEEETMAALDSRVEEAGQELGRWVRRCVGAFSARGRRCRHSSNSSKQLRGVAVLCFLSFPFSPLILTRNYAKS